MSASSGGPGNNPWGTRGPAVAVGVPCVPEASRSLPRWAKGWPRATDRPAPSPPPPRSRGSLRHPLRPALGGAEPSLRPGPRPERRRRRSPDSQLAPWSRKIPGDPGAGPCAPEHRPVAPRRDVSGASTRLGHPREPTADSLVLLLHTPLLARRSHRRRRDPRSLPAGPRPGCATSLAAPSPARAAPRLLRLRPAAPRSPAKCGRPCLRELGAPQQQGGPSLLDFAQQAAPGTGHLPRGGAWSPDRSPDARGGLRGDPVQLGPRVARGGPHCRLQEVSLQGSVHVAAAPHAAGGPCLRR